MSVAPSTIALETFTLSLNVLEPLAGITALLVQVAVSSRFAPEDTTHDQTAPFAPLAIRGDWNESPAGNTSLTVMMPNVGSEIMPPFLTVNEYSPVEPAPKITLLSDLTKDRSGGHSGSSRTIATSSTFIGLFIETTAEYVRPDSRLPVTVNSTQGSLNEFPAGNVVVPVDPPGAAGPVAPTPSLITMLA